MSHLDIYTDLSLNTDLYQLTMAQGYWGEGRHEEGAIFNLFFRECPFGGDYVVAAGLQSAVQYLNNEFGFDKSDLEYLQTLEGNDGEPLFQDEFLAYLYDMGFECEVKGIPEGSIVFPHEPLLRVEGPIAQAQLVETALINFINYQSLVATKASRIRSVIGEDDALLEFGLRRAQGIDGGLSAARAAYIGGANGTSNVLAGKHLDIPVKGTHAHSWVQSFDTEEDSFEAWRRQAPNNGVFLVDTYDTIQGVKKAIRAAEKLREEGYKMAGVRLDSGDLAELSKKARRLLDEAGFEEAKVVASDGLDVDKIVDILSRGGEIDAWGVGTNLVTCKGDPALGCVYKLAMVDDQPKLKLSEDKIKTSIPGKLNVARFEKDGRYIADMIYNQSIKEQASTNILGINHTDTIANVSGFDKGHQLLQEPDISEGLDDMRNRRDEQLRKLEAGDYPVGLESFTSLQRDQLIEEMSNEL